MNNSPTVSIYCFGENALALCSAIFCAKTITGMLRGCGYSVGGYLTDCINKNSNEQLISQRLISICKTNNLIITIGNDGFSENDIIPDITKEICEKDAPFFALFLCGAATYCAYEQKTLHNVYPTRSTAGVCGNCLIINLPSDEECAREKLYLLLPTLNFTLFELSGKSAEDSKFVENNINKCLPNFGDKSTQLMTKNKIFSRYQGDVN